MFLVKFNGSQKEQQSHSVRLVKTCVGPGVRMGNKGGREIKVGSVTAISIHFICTRNDKRTNSICY